MADLYLANLGARGSLNGQVQKSVAVRRLLESMAGDPRVVDVSESPFAVLYLLWHSRRYDRVFLALGQKGIRVALALVALRGLLRRDRPRVHYLVVGGWLLDLLDASWWLRRFVGQVDDFLVESEALRDGLARRGHRAWWFPNFRSGVAADAKDLVSEKRLRLCFCSRVRTDKGIFEAMDLARVLSDRGFESSLDVYGPLESEAQGEFHRRLAQGAPVRYRGPYDACDVFDILRAYDFLVLPTTYEGECMPGVVVEAFCVATPVVSTDWRFMAEYIRDGVNGVVCSADGFVDEAAERLESLVASGGYRRMSEAAADTFRREYSENAATGILKQVLAS